MNKYNEVFDFLKNKITKQPLTSIVLGSGLGNFVDDIKKEIIIPTADIPGYPKSTVEGHSGKIILGYIEDIPILVFQGRIHFYEGYDISDTIFTSVISHLLGAKTVIFTNVSGGISYKPGSIVILDDHINMTFKNPVIKLKNYFPGFQSDMHKQCYDPSLIENAFKVSKENNIEIVKGTYAWTLGPSYETPAEIKMFQKMGAHMVGMSTVPEVLAAHFLGLKVMGISLISNYASGITNQKLSHQEVIEMGEKYKAKLNFFLQKVILKINK
jgi:purine-nucleoside phosphorylase